MATAGEARTRVGQLLWGLAWLDALAVQALWFTRSASGLAASLAIGAAIVAAIAWMERRALATALARAGTALRRAARDRDERLAAAGLLAVAALVLLARAPLVEHALGGFSSDDAIEGLMARHILEGRERPMMFYGQPYAGTLKSHLVAAYGGLGDGVSAAAYRLGGLSFFLVFLVALGVLGLRAYGPAAAIAATALAGVASATLLDGSVGLPGGYMEVLAFGTCALLLVPRPEADAALPRWRAGPAAAAGLLLGLGAWSSLLVAPFAITWGLASLARTRRLPPPPVAAAFAAGAVTGLFPMLLYNALEGGATYTSFLADRRGTGERLARAVEAARVLATRTYPRLVQVLVAGPSGATPAVYGVDLAAVGGTATALIWGAWRGVRGFARSRLPGADLATHRMLLGLALATLAVVLASKFGRTPVARYLVPLTVPVALLSGAGLVALGRRHPRAMVAMLAVALGAGVLSSKRMGEARAEVARHRMKLIATLEERGCRFIGAGYWYAYWIDFASGERIVASPVVGPLPIVRYPPYRDAVLAAPPERRGYVFPQGSAEDRHFARTGGAQAPPLERIPIGALAAHCPRR